MASCQHCGSGVSASDVRCANCGKEIPARTDDLIGKSLAGKYLIEEHLGSGGMCDVYLATNAAMGKQVAVKLLKPSLAADPTIAQRFEQEARAASMIHHPHAINVMDYGFDEDNIPFIVMEFVRGITLGELLRKNGALPIERAADILRQISGALDVAHSVGVIHRDIKPDNIIIAEYDGSDWIEVLDFGVAKLQEDLNKRSSLTGANIIVGTPRYMSPEQCEERPVDARSDIYSLGIVLYEMLSGEAPFKGDSSTRLLVAHASEPPEPLRNKRPDIAPEIEAVVMSTLEKDPRLRPQSAGELASRFQEAAGLGQQAQAGAGRAGAFSRISVPLGEKARDEDDTPVAMESQEANAAIDEATIVRPRPARSAAASTSQNQQGMNSSAGSANQSYDSQPSQPTPPGGATYVHASHSYGKHNNTAGIAALVIVLLAVAGVAAYLVFGTNSFGRNSTSGAVIDAQQAVTEAIARVDSLPKDHPLRSYLSDLRQWQGELKAYQEVRENNPQITDKADRYKQKAEEISDQVRTAQAASGRQPANTSTISATPAQSTPPAEAAKPKDEARPDAEEESAADDKASSATPAEKDETEANKNKSKPRSAEPPAIDPVKPSAEGKPPAEGESKNSNRSNKNSPPKVEKINPDDK